MKEILEEKIRFIKILLESSEILLNSPSLHKMYQDKLKDLLQALSKLEDTKNSKL